MTYSVHEAKTHLSKLLDMIEMGEEVVIMRHGEPAARLVASRTNKKPLLGSMRGEFGWTEGWEKPHSDQEAENFLEGKE